MASPAERGLFMAKHDWKIIYSGNSPVEMRALEFLYGEMGNFMLRDWGTYALYTMACERASGELPDENSVVIGVGSENELLKKFIDPAAIPADGFILQKRDNPQYPGKQLVLIAGSNAAAVLYGVVTLVDDVLLSQTPRDNNAVISDTDVFGVPMKDFTMTDAPASRIRSVFTWAHPIGNMYEYFRNMARLKFNRVYMWNEFPPVNAAEIVNYAHSWGIETFWGFAWGWSTNCPGTDTADLDALRKNILDEYYDVWAKLPGDGIYFQSFTEMVQREINGRSVADCVIELVNGITGELLKKDPALKIVFGLHASSVKDDLEIIARSDARLEILWEDCGNFPFNCINEVPTPGKDLAFVRDLFAQNHFMGLVYKCQLTQKWADFAHQSGAYILGHNGSKMQTNDLAVTESSWRNYKAVWSEHGKIAYDLAQVIQSEGGPDVEMNVAAQLNGPIHWPTALTAELFWNSNRNYIEIVKCAQRKIFVL